jgi:hypothetical protein
MVPSTVRSLNLVQKTNTNQIGWTAHFMCQKYYKKEEDCQAPGAHACKS